MIEWCEPDIPGVIRTVRILCRSGLSPALDAFDTRHSSRPARFLHNTAHSFTDSAPRCIRDIDHAEGGGDSVGGVGIAPDDRMDDMRLVVLSLGCECRRIQGHLQRRHTHVPLSDAEAWKKSARPSALAVPAIHICLRGKDSGIFLENVDAGKPAESELCSVVGPGIKPCLQHELVKINVA